MPSRPAPPAQSFSATVERDGTSCFIVLPFDPKAAFGAVRAPVTVTVDGYTFRSRVVAMGGPACIGLRREHRAAAGLSGGETVAVTVALDTAPRTIDAPADLLRALKAAPGALDRWQALSYTHQREHVEAIDDAKKPETRARRIAAAVAMVADQATADSPSTARSGATHSARARTSRTTSKL
jgi:hypothetical protein